MRQLVLTSIMALCLSAGLADANTISGSLWRVDEAISLNAIPANVPATTADVEFQVNSPFNFNSFGGYTIGDFLSSGGAFNVTENTLGTLANLMDSGGFGTLMVFTGLVTVVNGQTFTVAHDDGLSLIIGGLNLGFNPGPTAPTVSSVTYTGPSGNFAFQLVYGECCGAPAVLQVDLPFRDAPAVPLPAALPLLATGLGLLGFVGTKRRQKKSAA